MTRNLLPFIHLLRRRKRNEPDYIALTDANNPSTQNKETYNCLEEIFVKGFLSRGESGPQIPFVWKRKKFARIWPTPLFRRKWLVNSAFSKFSWKLGQDVEASRIYF